MYFYWFNKSFLSDSSGGSSSRSSGGYRKPRNQARNSEGDLGEGDSYLSGDPKDPNQC